MHRIQNNSKRKRNLNILISFILAFTIEELQGSSDHIRTYASVYLENLKRIFYLFIYLFTYRFFGKKRLSHARVFSYYCCYFTKRKLFEYCTIHFNTRVQNPVITTVMVETLVSTCAAERSFSGMKRLKTLLRSEVRRDCPLWQYSTYTSTRM